MRFVKLRSLSTTFCKLTGPLVSRGVLCKEIPLAAVRPEVMKIFEMACERLFGSGMIDEDDRASILIPGKKSSLLLCAFIAC